MVAIVFLLREVGASPRSPTGVSSSISFWRFRCSAQATKLRGRSLRNPATRSAKFRTASSTSAG